MASNLIEISLIIAGVLATGVMLVSLMALSMVVQAASVENSVPASQSISETNSVMTWQPQGVPVSYPNTLRRCRNGHR